MLGFSVFDKKEQQVYTPMHKEKFDEAIFQYISFL